MAEIRRYTLVDTEGNDEDREFDTLDEAKEAATDGQAVMTQVYEWSDSQLAWTPDGGFIWPPVEKTGALVSGDELVLEVRDQADGTVRIGGVVMMTPPVGEDYWTYRVRLSETQAVIGFPKFGTVGVGFAEEEDWNTNLPYSVGDEKIFKHISHNKGDARIDDDDVRTAIRLVVEAATKARGV